MLAKLVTASAVWVCLLSPKFVAALLVPARWEVSLLSAGTGAPSALSGRSVEVVGPSPSTTTGPGSPTGLATASNAHLSWTYTPPPSASLTPARATASETPELPLSTTPGASPVSSASEAPPSTTPGASPVSSGSEAPPSTTPVPSTTTEVLASSAPTTTSEPSQDPPTPSVPVSVGPTTTPEPSEVPLTPSASYTATPTPSPTPSASCSSVGIGAKCDGNRTGVLRLSNKGPTDLNVFEVLSDGSLVYRWRLRSGFTQRVRKACAGQKWLIKDLCHMCVHVVEMDNSRFVHSNVGVTDSSGCPPFPGEWAPVVNWTVIPVGLANVPGTNLLLGFAAQGEESYSKNPIGSVTQAALYDPESGTMTETDLNGHDIFCAALTLLPDGSLFAGGGGQAKNSYRVSTFDPITRSWSRRHDMNVGHWYGTAIVTADDRVLVSLGHDQLDSSWRRVQDFPEVSASNFDFDAKWSSMLGIDYLGRHADKKHWYPQQHLMANGKILHYGTQNSMYAIDTVGPGNITYVGERNTERVEDQAWGATSVFYENGKVLTLGGIEGWNGDRVRRKSVFKRAIAIDFRDPDTVATKRASDLHYQRAFPNAVALPDGTVLVIGGKNNTRQWDDSHSVLTPELWNPRTDTWKVLAPHQKPRNYHSTAMLLQDGRVFAGGGGLCGNDCALNQPNSEIFVPPYLFNQDGSLRRRPALSRVRRKIRAFRRFKVRVSGAGARRIARFSLVKQSVVTHGISTDQRQLALRQVKRRKVRQGVFEYTVKAPYNYNVVTRGWWFLFALNQEGTPSKGAQVKVV